ncbi:sulfotransferase [Thetidibacter halocola]|uniref:Sulfotransferase n=1 Tax=Thetidibacter halocola TaxID=2827239 RepID=A0A8J7WI10_9RHOB|nr:sulfotransferase [Thetidibacter halocola]MBS0125693.1 sulfotransferase [Thetidibacter halocola]
MQRFIILGQPRSGTTHLTTLLDSHPDVICAGELFNPYIMMGMTNDAGDDAILARDAAPRRAAEAFFEQAEAEGARAAGFKFMLGHDIAVLKWISRNPDIRIIYIRRANKLAQVASLIKANQTREWVDNEVANTPLRRVMRRVRIVYQGLFVLGRKERPNLVPTIRDIDENGRLIVGPRRISQRWHDLATSDFLASQWLRSTPNKVLRLEYVASLKPEAHERICRFLGVSTDAEIASPLRKQGANRVIDRFANQKQISDYFTRRGLAHWLGEELDEGEDTQDRDEA